MLMVYILGNYMENLILLLPLIHNLMDNLTGADQWA